MTLILRDSGSGFPQQVNAPVAPGQAETVFNLLRIIDRKSTRLNSSHSDLSRMPSSA